MKKIIAVLFMVALVATVSAQGLAVGGGVAYMPTVETMAIELPPDEGKDTMKFSALAAQMFVEGKYFQVVVGYQTIMEDGTYISELNGAVTESEVTFADTSFVTFALYGQYPVSVGQVKIIPLAGVQYDLNIEYAGPDPVNLIWFKAGCGAEIAIGQKIYIKPEILGGIRLLTADEKDFIDMLEGLGATVAVTGFRLDLGLKVGFRL